MAIANLPSRTSAVGQPASSNKVALAVVTTLFFMWGFVTVLNDVLVPHLKSIFDLNYAKVMLIQFAFFSAYFLFSIPSAKVIDWIGYKKTMVVGLCTMGLGALLFIPAASVPSYPLFLGALMVLAAGITALQVAANPYVAVLGPAGDCIQSLESGASVQLPGDNDRSLSWRHADPECNSPEHGHGPANVRRRAAGVPHP